MNKKTPELVAEALRLRKQGMTLAAIGRQLGVGGKTINCWIDPEATEKRRERVRKWQEANRERARELCRKWQEANREKARESCREWREANPERARESGRRCREANTLKHAKGKPLKSDYRKAARPVILTKLLLQTAKDFCLEWDFPVEQMFDEDVLRSAARTVRESPFLNGERNPWYGTDYLHESTVTSRGWAYSLAKAWRNRA